jgi:hypothetical protein
MNVYEVVITAVIISNLRVIAENSQEAIDQAQRMFRNDHDDEHINEIFCRRLSA